MATIKITVTRPSETCPFVSGRPSLAWQIDHRQPDSLTYRVRIAALKEGRDGGKIIAAGPWLVDERVNRRLAIDFPPQVKSLPPGPYVLEVAAEQQGRVVAVSAPRLMYVEPGDLPVSLRHLLCCNDILSGKWRKAYGTPSIQAKAKGALPGDSALITLKGNQTEGDGVWNEADDGFVQGRAYAIKFSARFLPKDAPYARLRVLAFNGDLPTDSAHPALGSDVALVAETGDIRGKDWQRILLPSWRASKDYSRIAVIAVTGTDTALKSGHVEVADVCVSESDDCGPRADVLQPTGKVAIPGEWKAHVQPGSKAGTVEVDFEQGSMEDLYGPMFDALGNSNWNQHNECLSIGGIVPPEAEEQLKEFGDTVIDGISPEQIQNGVLKVLDAVANTGDYDHLTPLEGDNDPKCRPPSLDKALPFSGRDIVYVHGFSPSTVLAGIEATMNNTPSDALLVWPTDEAAFEDGGAFRTAAQLYWRNHINLYLQTSGGYTNRHLAAAFNSNQRLLECAHAVLGQIAKAMNSGEGVVPSVRIPNTDCFGRDLVLVSHSTGALVVSVAMSLAARTATDPQLRAMFGDVSYIPSRCKVHVSMHGALAGSELAALAVVGANLLAGFALGSDVAVDVGIAVNNVDPALSLLRRGLTGFGINVPAIETAIDAATDSLVSFATAASRVVNGSVLVDLSPPVAKLLWGASLATSPVPTLTVAGAHPTPPGTELAAKLVLPGLDDGVVNTNSQSASFNLFPPDQYLVLPPIARVYDMVRPIERSAIYFAEQARDSNQAAYGSTAFLSPTGMVQPVDLVIPPPRYANHFTFLQSASNHNHTQQTPAQPYEVTPAVTSATDPPNFEETLVIERPEPFTLGLVNPSIAQAVTSRTRGLDLVITLRIRVPVISLFPPSITTVVIVITVVLPICAAPTGR